MLLDALEAHLQLVALDIELLPQRKKGNRFSEAQRTTWRRFVSLKPREIMNS
jgi:hypothetical protein